MVKITYLGAGSGFAPVLSKDIFQIPGLDTGEYCLVDIDPEMTRLSARFPPLAKLNAGAFSDPRVTVVNQDANTNRTRRHSDSDRDTIVH